QLLLQLEARHPGKAMVDDQAGGRLFSGPAQEALSGLERVDVEAFLAEESLDRRPHDGVVFDDADHRARGSGAGTHGSPPAVDRMEDMTARDDPHPEIEAPLLPRAREGAGTSSEGGLLRVRCAGRASRKRPWRTRPRAPRPSPPGASSRSRSTAGARESPRAFRRGGTRRPEAERAPS